MAKYAAAGVNIEKEVCGNLPDEVHGLGRQEAQHQNRDCVRCMHCINVMPKALRPGKEKGAVILIGAKAPIVQGALLVLGAGSVRARRRTARHDQGTASPRIWDFWDEYGTNRERIGELIQRVGLPAFPRRHRAGSGAGDGGGAARQPLHLLPGREGGETMTTTPTSAAITDIGPPRYDKFLPPIVKTNYGHVEVSRDRWRPACWCHVAESGDKLYTRARRFAASAKHPDAPQVRRAGRQILRRVSALHQPQ